MRNDRMTTLRDFIQFRLSGRVTDETLKLEMRNLGQRRVYKLRMKYCNHGQWPRRETW